MRVGLLLSGLIGSAFLLGCRKDDCSLSSTCADPTKAPPTAADGGLDDAGLPLTGFVLDPLATPPRLVAGGDQKIAVTIRRAPSFQDDVDVVVSNLPTGVTAAKMTLTANASSIEVTVAAAAAAPHGPYGAIINATSKDHSESAPLSLYVRGKPGSVDTTFRNGGTALNAGSSDAKPLLGRNDEIYVAVACGMKVCVHRFSSDGVLDASFGGPTNGVEKLNYHRAMLDGSGRVVVAGGPPTESASLVRFNTSGQQDVSLGRVAIDVGLEPTSLPARVERLGLCENGDFYVAFAHDSNMSAGLRRFTANGAFDTQFGPNGYRAFVFGAGLHTVGGVQCAKDGSVTVSGTDASGLGVRIVRLKSNGQFDATFGTGGLHAFDMDVGAGTSLHTMPDGRLLAGFGKYSVLTLVMFAANGKSLDTSFGGNGKPTFPYSRTGGPTSVAVQKDGKIVASIFDNTASAERMMRVKADGSGLDTTFATNGEVALPETNVDTVGALVQADGRIVLVSNGINSIHLTRFWD